ncbi:MAG TPA: hypothetical protein VGG09_15605 [Acidimicrobiales bacterium]|jgi:hypothetical protein
MPTHCTPRIDDAGLEDRFEMLLARERRLYPSMVMTVIGSPRSRPTGAEDKLTLEILEPALSADDVARQAAGCFLAGRCDPDDDPDGAARLAAGCSTVAAGDPYDEFGVRARTVVEAAMSLILRGDQDLGVAALRALVERHDAQTGAEPLAGFYLAQTGDPSGWLSMLAALRDKEDPVLRLRAARLVIAFVPHEGRKVGSETVDVQSALTALSKDKDRYVTEAIPEIQAEVDAARASLGST